MKRAVAETMFPGVIEVDHYGHQWTIDNAVDKFVSLSETCDIHSDIILTNTSSWTLRLSQNRKGTPNEDWLSLRLRLEPSAAEVVVAGFRVTLIHATNSRPGNHTRESRSYQTFDKTRRLSLAVGNFIKKETCLSPERGFLTANGSIIIECIIKVVREPLLFCTTEAPALKKLKLDLGSMRREDLSSDVSLWAGGKEFKAHKGILSARSPVFRAMFQHNMTEAQEGRVDIEDIQPEVLDILLQFIYTGGIPKVANFAMDLLATAEKYDIQTLSSICEEELTNDINPNNVANILKLAYLYHKPELKRNALLFITESTHKFLQTAGWKKLLRENHEIVTDIVKALAGMDVDEEDSETGEEVQEEDEAVHVA